MNQSDQDFLREQLNFYKIRLGLTQTELAEGLKLSRPTVAAFLDPEHKNKKLAVNRDNLIHLWESLGMEGELEPILDIEQIEGESLKKLVHKLGPDELLQSSGQLPEKAKAIRVPANLYYQMLQIGLILEMLEFNEALFTVRECFSIAQNKLLSADNKLFGDNKRNRTNDALQHLINQLPTADLTLGLTERINIIKKLEKTHIRLLKGGKVDFNKQEAISLFLSITLKQKISQELADIKLRIQKLEFKTLSISIEDEEEYLKDESKDLYRELLYIGSELESQLKNTPFANEDEQGVGSRHLFNPVVTAIVTYRLGFNGQPSDQIEATYTSSSTMNENALSALSLYLGFSKDMEQVYFLSTKVLNTHVNGLVESSVILEDKARHYQGIWVDRDGMITQLQAIAEAGKHWLSEKFLQHQLEPKIYESACKTVSRLRKQLFQSRKAFYSFQFLNLECSDSQLSNLANIAQEELSKIPIDKIYMPHRFSLYRCYFQAKLLQIRQANLQGKLNDVNELLKEIGKVFIKDEAIQIQFTTINAQSKTETYLYQLSHGHEPALFDDSKRKEYINLNEEVERIINTIQQENFYKDPGVDIYQSLSELIGNAARLDFYLSNDRTIVEESRKNFLKAAYYAGRFGAIRRMARWIAFAGRASVRLGDRNSAFQALKFSYQLMNKTLTSEHGSNFKDALLSEIYLLEGEYHLLLVGEIRDRDTAWEAVQQFFKALKGSMYLGFNRRIADSLFNIARCSNSLENISLKEGLKIIFTKDNRQINLEEGKFENLVEDLKNELNPTGNSTSVSALKLLFDLWFKDNYTFFDSKDDFLNEFKRIWNRWHNITKQSESKNQTIHPIVQRIEKAKNIKDIDWLKQV